MLIFSKLKKIHYKTYNLFKGLCLLGKRIDGCELHFADYRLHKYIELFPLKKYNAIYGTIVNHDNIVWNKDFINGNIFPVKFSLFYKISNYFNKGADIKVCWDLSRLYFLPLRAIKSNNYNNYTEFKEVLKNWSKHNPFLKGVNWIVGMEVGIRAINIVLAASYYREYIKSDIGFENFLSKLLIKHAFFLYNYPEVKPDGTGNNHLIADYSALFILSCVLNNHVDSKHWRKMSTEGLEQTMVRQVLEDGANFEDSTSYHRLVLELYAYSYFFALDHRINFSKLYKKRLFKMFEYVATYINSDGIAPQVGDNDSGRVFDLFELHERDHAYLLKMRSYFFPEEKMSNIDNQANIMVKHYEKAGRLKIRHGGYDILAVLNSSYTKKSKSHSHDDATSYTLSYKGKEFIVDPGTYCYTKDIKWRNYFRSKQRHNIALSVNEIIEPKAKTSFFGKFVTIESELKKISSDSIVMDAYSESKTGLVFKKTRTITYRKGIIEINDVVKGEFQSLIHLHPKCKVKLLSNNTVELQRDSECLTIRSDSKILINEYWYSDGYMRKEESKVLVFNALDMAKVILYPKE